jgi:hypothetical protein
MRLFIRHLEQKNNLEIWGNGKKCNANAGVGQWASMALVLKSPPAEVINVPTA